MWLEIGSGVLGTLRPDTLSDPQAYRDAAREHNLALVGSGQDGEGEYSTQTSSPRIDY